MSGNHCGSKQSTSPGDPLTERQKSIFDYMAEYESEKSQSPTLREIAEEFDMTVPGVQFHLRALTKKGRVVNAGRYAHRGYRVVSADETEATPDPVVPLGGNDCCRKPLPDIIDEPEPAAVPAPAGYDLGVLEAVLSDVWGMLSAAHAGLICTPPETAAPTLVLSLAMEKIESLIGEVREALGEGGDDE